MKTPRKDDAFPILLGLLSNVKPYQATRTLLILPCWGGCFGQRLWPYQLRIIIVLTSWQLLNLRSYSTFGEFGTSWVKRKDIVLGFLPLFINRWIPWQNGRALTLRISSPSGPKKVGDFFLGCASFCVKERAFEDLAGSSRAEVGISAFSRVSMLGATWMGGQSSKIFSFLQLGRIDLGVGVPNYENL